MFESERANAVARANLVAPTVCVGLIRQCTCMYVGVTRQYFAVASPVASAIDEWPAFNDIFTSYCK